MIHEEHEPRKDLKSVKLAAVAVLILSFALCLGGIIITAQQRSEAEARRKADIARMAEINLARMKLEETVAKNKQEAAARERVATMDLHKSLAKIRRWPAIYLRHRQMRAIPSTLGQTILSLLLLNSRRLQRLSSWQMRNGKILG